MTGISSLFYVEGFHGLKLVILNKVILHSLSIKVHISFRQVPDYPLYSCSNHYLPGLIKHPYLGRIETVLLLPSSSSSKGRFLESDILRLVSTLPTYLLTIFERQCMRAVPWTEIKLRPLALKYTNFPDNKSR